MADNSTFFFATVNHRNTAVYIWKMSFWIHIKKIRISRTNLNPTLFYTNEEREEEKSDVYRRWHHSLLGHPLPSLSYSNWSIHSVTLLKKNYFQILAKGRTEFESRQSWQCRWSRLWRRKTFRAWRRHDRQAAERPRCWEAMYATNPPPANENHKWRWHSNDSGIISSYNYFRRQLNVHLRK